MRANAAASDFILNGRIRRRSTLSGAMDGRVSSDQWRTRQFVSIQSSGVFLLGGGGGDRSNHPPDSFLDVIIIFFF